MVFSKRKEFIFGVYCFLGASVFVLIFLNSTNKIQSYHDSERYKIFDQKSVLDSNHNSERNTNDPSKVEEIIANIKRHNELQPILNEDRFGPLEPDSVVIVVQVHTRIDYLQHLIASLSQAKDISSTLLIFSHDHYDENINDLIRKIEFCKVLQIFYPHSIQTHEHEFPGEDPNDCSPNISRDEAIKLGCNNAHNPDRYGHYRTAKITQIKHHWWWKANRVFDQLAVTRHHTGLVLLLEEDHYVAEDFLHVLNLMPKKADAECKKCNIFTLANHMKKFNVYKRAKFNEVTVIPWSHTTNLGFAFNRRTWHEILKCANTFCTYDDYNWDYSLHHISQSCMSQKLFTMIPTRARAFHIGICGSHAHNGDCDPNKLIAEIRNLLQSTEQSNKLYPESLKIIGSVANDELLGNSNGGWGDVRDHQLCLKSLTTQ